MSFICKRENRKMPFFLSAARRKKGNAALVRLCIRMAVVRMRSREFRNEMEYALHLAKRRKLRRIEGMKLRWRVRSKNGQKVGDGWSDRTRTIGQGPWR